MHLVLEENVGEECGRGIVSWLVRRPPYFSLGKLVKFTFVKHWKQKLANFKDFKMGMINDTRPEGASHI
jgi:hypothetical protein